jgi:hypothetical protein
MSTNEEWVLLRSFGYRHEAEFACNALDGDGIDSRLMADDSGGAHPGLAFSNPAGAPLPGVGAGGEVDGGTLYDPQPSGPGVPQYR